MITRNPQHPAHVPAPAPPPMNGAYRHLGHDAQVAEIHKAAAAFEALLGRVNDSIKKAGTP